MNYLSIPIYSFSDGAKNDKQDIRNVNEVEKNYQTCLKILIMLRLLKEKNFGLYENFTSGITEICNSLIK